MQAAMSCSEPVECARFWTSRIEPSPFAPTVAGMCALAPDRMGRLLVDHGFWKNYGYTVQTLKEIPWTRWRDYDPADSMRFYALRLHETGLLKTSPQKILARSTDWRAFNELKKEIKAEDGRRLGPACGPRGLPLGEPFPIAPPRLSSPPPRRRP